MKNNSIVFLVIFMLLLVITSCSNQEPDNQNSKLKEINLLVGSNNSIVTAKVVDTYVDRMNGLMFREELGEFDGMFFVFEDESVLSFWMKNTLIPLDIIFIDANMTVVMIHEADPCVADPCPNFSSNYPSKYVLEVNQGFSKKYDLKVGDKIYYATSK